MADRYRLYLNWQSPVSLKTLARERLARIDIPVPAPLLRPRREGDAVPGGPWGEVLAEMGWTWTVSEEACRPKLPPLFKAWMADWDPARFPWREWSLAARLEMLYLGKRWWEEGRTPEEMVEMVHEISPQALREALALKLLQDPEELFDLSGEAPDWMGNVTSARFERQPTSRRRRPNHPWLRKGYELFHRSFWEKEMERCRTFDEFEALWEKRFADTLPSAFQLAYWWEVHYRLSERAREKDAQKSLNRIEGLYRSLSRITKAIDPWWLLQHSRHSYYEGDLVGALARFGKIWKQYQEEIKRYPNLLRHIANVLSDMGCLALAREFAKWALKEAEKLGLEEERFKTLGRLGEIAVKQGDLDRAVDHYRESLAVQESLGYEGDRLNQTLITLGHVERLRGDFDEAERRYRRAEENGLREGDLPYWLMGQFSLARARGEEASLAELWKREGDRVKKLLEHRTHVLPAAVIIFTTREVHGNQDLLREAVQALLQRHYTIEALGSLALLPFSPESAWKEAIRTTLNAWRRALVRQRFPTDEMEGYLAVIENLPDRLALWSYPVALAV